MIKLLLLMALLAGCTSYTPPKVFKIPVEHVYRKVASKPYVRNVYDCSNKSAEYVNALWDAGYADARIYILQKDFIYHAIVWVDGMFLDPTISKICPTLDYWDSRLVLILDQKKYAKFLKWNESEWSY
jgi:hypothetical protein